jgi:hypothetical protein
MGFLGLLLRAGDYLRVLLEGIFWGIFFRGIFFRGIFFRGIFFWGNFLSGFNIEQVSIGEL